MINPTLNPIEIDGITYDVEFNESTDRFILTSSFQDIEIPANDLLSKAIDKHRFDLGDGELNYNDSDISNEIAYNAESFIRDNFKKGEVVIWPTV